MAPRNCPIKFDGKCRYCPFHPWERLKRCKFYRRQIISGVPWHWRADWHYHYDVEDLREEALKIEAERRLKIGIPFTVY
jgi:hypothetical protein